MLVAFAWTGAYDLATGIVLAQLAAISLLALYGFSIGWVIYRRAVPGLLHAAFTSGIGVALALIKFLLHG